MMNLVLAAFVLELPLSILVKCTLKFLLVSWTRSVVPNKRKEKKTKTNKQKKNKVVYLLGDNEGPIQGLLVKLNIVPS